MKSLRLALLAALVLFLAPAAADAAVESAVPSGEDAARGTYWTPERMEAAIPATPSLEGEAVGLAGDPSAAEPARAVSGRAQLVANPTAGGVRAHGKVFFRLGGQDFVCSGTVVGSRSKSTVWTAGHCVKDAGRRGRFASRWIFVPAYANGQAPYGQWSAKRLFTTGEWGRRGDLSYDLGAAAIRKKQGGRTIGSVTGGRGIKFGAKLPRRIDAYGYPAEPNSATNRQFDGERGYRCNTRRTGRDRAGTGKPTIKIACDMTGGASGGGWLTPSNKLIAASSYVRDAEGNRVLYASYMGSSAKRVYKAASRR